MRENLSEDESTLAAAFAAVLAGFVGMAGATGYLMIRQIDMTFEFNAAYRTQKTVICQNIAVDFPEVNNTSECSNSKSTLQPKFNIDLNGNIRQ